MTCAAYIEDHQHRVTLLSGQSVGVVAGEKPGEIQVWLNRKVFSNDNRGLGQALTDVKPSRSVFRILVERISPPVEDLQVGVTFVVGCLSYLTLILHNLNGTIFMRSSDLP